MGKADTTYYMAACNLAAVVTAALAAEHMPELEIPLPPCLPSMMAVLQTWGWPPDKVRDFVTADHGDEDSPLRRYADEVAELLF